MCVILAVTCSSNCLELQATTVSPRKEYAESRDAEVDIEDKLCESNFVGTVHNLDQRAIDSGLMQGDVVTSIHKCGTKARFVTMPARSLVVLPERLDAGEAVSIVSVYLPAFEALHHGRREFRYSPMAFTNKKILITGGGRLEAQAAVKLALWGGADKVYLVKSGVGKVRNTYGDQVSILDSDPKMWIQALYKKIDVVVDFEFPVDFDAIAECLNVNGRLVCNSPSKERRLQRGWISEIESALEIAALYLMTSASIFDFDEMCDNEPAQVEVRSKRFHFLSLHAKVSNSNGEGGFVLPFPIVGQTASSSFY